MKNYKDYLQTNIGYSDIASLTIRSCGIVAPLDFGSDGDYRAYVVDDNAEIPSHYQLVQNLEHWVHIFDDAELTFSAKADHIRIYRAGDFGCIIQLDGNAEVEKIVTISELMNKLEQATQRE